MRRPWILAAAMVAAWCVLAAWQYHEYGHECEAAQQTVRRQGDALLGALVGGLRSHRRLGRFFEEQIQAVVDELAAAQDVLAVAVVGEGGKPTLSAARTAPPTRLDPEPPEAWLPEGYRVARRFEIQPAGRTGGGGGPAGAGSGLGTGPGAGPGGGSSLGGGPGGWGQGLGRGWGRGVGRFDEPDETGDRPAALVGGSFTAVLLLDRSGVDAAARRAQRNRLSIVAAGTLVLASVALAWRATGRLSEARNRARLLEAEARHLRDLSQAAAGLAHETRNPLGVIRGWAQRLSQSVELPAEARQHARALIEECDRVAARINQFLAFARAAQPRWEPVELAELVEQLGALLQPDLESRSLTLVVEVDRPTALRADREMLRQALFNLLQNAVEFSPPGASIEIRARRRRDGRLRVELCDRGVGVPETHRASLFTPYFTTRPGGTGLGLAIVRRVALAHGWQCGYEPRDGGGSVFFLDAVGSEDRP